MDSAEQRGRELERADIRYELERAAENAESRAEITTGAESQALRAMGHVLRTVIDRLAVGAHVGASTRGLKVVRHG